MTSFEGAGRARVCKACWETSLFVMVVLFVLVVDVFARCLGGCWRALCFGLLGYYLAGNVAAAHGAGRGRIKISKGNCHMPLTLFDGGRWRPGQDFWRGGPATLSTRVGTGPFAAGVLVSCLRGKPI